MSRSITELWDFQPYISDTEENDRIELGDRVARNYVAASHCEICGISPDGVWAWASFMFAQVCAGIRPYRKPSGFRKRVPRDWLPSPSVLREVWDE